MTVGRGCLVVLVVMGEGLVAGRRGGVVSDSLPSGKDVASYQVSVSLSFLRCTCIQRDSFIDNLLVRI